MKLKIVKGEKFELTKEESALLSRLWDRQKQNKDYLFTDKKKLIKEC